MDKKIPGRNPPETIRVSRSFRVSGTIVDVKAVEYILLSFERAPAAFPSLAIQRGPLEREHEQDGTTKE